MTEPIFVQQTQLYRIFIKDFSHFICFGTWQLINLKNFLPIFLFTIFENGELNHIILHFSSFLLIFVSVVLREYHIFVEITFIEGFSYSVLDLSNTIEKFVDNHLLIDFGRCSNI